MSDEETIKKRRKKKASHEDDEEGHDEGGGGHESDEHLWLYSFNDMLFNLLLFFIVMFSISSVNKSKFHAIADALHIPGKVTEDQEVLKFKRSNFASSGPSAADTLVVCNNPMMTPTGSSSKEFGQGPSAVSQGQGAGNKRVPEFKVTELSLEGIKYFYRNGPTPNPKAVKLLRKLSIMARKKIKTVRFEIESHVPENAVKVRNRGMQTNRKRQAAWALASRRATEIMDLLIDQGFEEELIKISAYGPLKSKGKKRRAKNKVLLRMYEPTGRKI